ncbi:MAG: MgtC/SapB family protein [Candidatus Pacebacteria bacterium]|nr:MgtC/SapB family protein [Candidatus Paceibacterota bacterium]
MGLEINHIIIFGQLTLAFLLGGILGFERLVAGKEAGMRTFGIVAIGSCLFVIVGEVMARQYAGVVNFDPTRLASSVVTGIGFIGAGLIIFQHELKGLTTAAVLWVASAIGVAVGFKMYMIAIFTTFLTLFVCVGVWYIERFLERIVAHERLKK